MSELIAMRQRIKAVETIKKVTHAMRLISMSLHSRIKSNKTMLQEYKNTILHIIKNILYTNPSWTNPILWPSAQNNRPLSIIIGSQKGLCGNFNANLFSFFKKETAALVQEELLTIVIGKKATDYIDAPFGTIVMQFSEFSQHNLLSIAEKIADHIWHARVPYTSVTLYFNNPKTFFAQLPEKYQLIPFENRIESKEIMLKEPYRWEQSPETILNVLVHKFLQSIIQEILFESLIAEQAARFIAMDSSTRNASNLLDAMHLDYNKLRQSKITKQLTDLIASF
jgi:F-type H+-transporting ATPase subunit gamma